MRLRLPRTINTPIWSIKVYPSASPVLAQPSSEEWGAPTVRASDVTDRVASFVADPFLVRAGSSYCLFYEVWDKVGRRGVIGLSVSEDGITWRYEGIVLDQPFHLSYPHVFEWEGEYYMVPESIAAGKVLLYKATRFPYEWKPVASLLKGRYTDPSLFQHGGKWWMYTGSEKGRLHLFYADRLDGNWREHPHSPVVSDQGINRPGGRVLVQGEQIYRYAQDCSGPYGRAIRLVPVTRLTEDDYAEGPYQEILSGSGLDRHWRKDGMHHIDQVEIPGKGWLVVVDGHRNIVHTLGQWWLERLKNVLNPSRKTVRQHEEEYLPG